MPTDYYPLQDLLYRTTALTDDAGDIVEAYDTDAYGNTLIFNAPGTGGDWWADDASPTDNPTNDFIFTGRRYDSETDIYYYRERYYDPRQGRFISRDPSGYVDGTSLYEYVRSAVIHFLDPTGTMHAPVRPPDSPKDGTDKDDKCLYGGDCYCNPFNRILEQPTKPCTKPDNATTYEKGLCRPWDLDKACKRMGLCSVEVFWVCKKNRFVPRQPGDPASAWEWVLNYFGPDDDCN